MDMASFRHVVMTACLALALVGAAETLAVACVTDAECGAAAACDAITHTCLESASSDGGMEDGSAADDSGDADATHPVGSDADADIPTCKPLSDAGDKDAATPLELLEASGFVQGGGCSASPAPPSDSGLVGLIGLLVVVAFGRSLKRSQ
jgi:MYXO-CTERM domain-containing protein